MNDLMTKDLPAYQGFLAQATAQIRQARTRAVQAVNKEAVSLYWWFGENIVQYQEKHGWGKSVVEHLSHDLKKFFPMQNLGFRQEICGICDAFILNIKIIQNCDSSSQKFLGDKIW